MLHAIEAPRQEADVVVVDDLGPEAARALQTIAVGHTPVAVGHDLIRRQAGEGSGSRQVRAVSRIGTETSGTLAPGSAGRPVGERLRRAQLDAIASEAELHPCRRVGYTRSK